MPVIGLKHKAVGGGVTRKLQQKIADKISREGKE